MRWLVLLTLLVGTPAAAAPLDLRVGVAFGLGPGPSIDGSARAAAAPGSPGEIPLASRTSLVVAIRDWGVELGGHGMPLRYDGDDRLVVGFEPAVRHDLARLGPLRLFVRGDLFLGRLTEEERGETCGEAGCTATVVPGSGAFGAGVGAGAALEVHVPDGGYFSVGAIATSDLLVIDGDATRVTGVIYGISFGTWRRD